MPSGMHVVKRLPPAKVLAKRIRLQIVKNTLPIVRKYAVKRQALVSGWKVKPKFVAEISQKDIVILAIVISNSDQRVRGTRTTVGMLWLWWEVTGTQPHKIRGNPLRFKVAGTTVFAYIVDHPGTKPKRKTPAFNKQLDAEVGQELQYVVRDGLK